MLKVDCASFHNSEREGSERANADEYDRLQGKDCIYFTLFNPVISSFHNK